MPYKRKEDKAAQMQRYRRRKEKTVKRKEVLVQLGYFFAGLYFDKLLKIDPNEKLVDGSSRVRGAIDLLVCFLQERRSLAYAFAKGLHALGGDLTAENLYRWVRALDKLARHPSKHNEELEREAYYAIPSPWHILIHDILLEELKGVI